MFKRSLKKSSKLKEAQTKQNSNVSSISIPQLHQSVLLDEFQDEPIHVIDVPTQNQRKSLTSNPHIKQKTIQSMTPTNTGIGIFSDTPIYSEFIRLSLQILEIDIKHYGHPSTFTPSAYAHYDDISAWIIFLSDGNDQHSIDRFLEQFLDRYVHKPTLFLCAETNIVKTSEKINQFVAETGLFKLPYKFMQTENKAFA